MSLHRTFTAFLLSLTKKCAKLTPLTSAPRCAAVHAPTPSAHPFANRCSCWISQSALASVGLMTTYIILVCLPCPTFAPLLPVSRVQISPPVRSHVRLALSRAVTHSLTGLALHTGWTLHSSLCLLLSDPRQHALGRPKSQDTGCSLKLVHNAPTPRRYRADTAPIPRRPPRRHCADRSAV